MRELCINDDYEFRALFARCKSARFIIENGSLYIGIGKKNKMYFNRDLPSNTVIADCIIEISEKALLWIKEYDHWRSPCAELTFHNSSSSNSIAYNCSVSFYYASHWFDKLNVKWNCEINYKEVA